MSYVRTEHEVAEKKVRRGRKTNYFLIPYNGIGQGEPPTKWKYIGDLGHLTDVGEVALEAINEELIVEIGNKPLTINDGYKVSDIAFTFHGNSIPTLAAMIGQDLTTNPAISIGQIFSNCCALICNSHDAMGKPQMSFIICDLSVRVTGLPGMTADGTSSWTINLFSDDAIVVAADKGFVFQAESWWDDAGNITNVNAPDGVAVDFILGEGNNINAAITPPIASAVKIRPDATGFLQYLVALKMNSYTGAAFAGYSDVTTSEATFNNALGKITFGTAPLDGSKLLTFYLVPEDDQNSLTATDKTQQFDQWQDFNYNS